MNRRFFTALFLVLFTLCFNNALDAFEIELTGGVNNMTFHPDRTDIFQSENPEIGQFSAYPFGDFILRGDIASFWGFNIHVSRDNILWNSLYTKLTLDTDYFNVNFGPFIGMTDDWIKGNTESPVFGLTGGIQIALPGVIFLSFDGSLALGSQFDFLSANTREAAEVRLGFWLPNMIPSVSASLKRYEQSLINDELIRFQASLEFFGKNSPLILRFEAANEILKRTYSGSELAEELNVLLAGFEMKLQVSRPLRMIAGFEMPVYIRESTVEPDNIYNLYRFHGGLTYTFFPRRSRPILDTYVKHKKE